MSCVRGQMSLEDDGRTILDSDTHYRWHETNDKRRHRHSGRMGAYQGNFTRARCTVLSFCCRIGSDVEKRTFADTQQRQYKCGAIQCKTPRVFDIILQRFHFTACVCVCVCVCWMCLTIRAHVWKPCVKDDSLYWCPYNILTGLPQIHSCKNGSLENLSLVIEQNDGETPEKLSSFGEFSKTRHIAWLDRNAPLLMNGSVCCLLYLDGQVVFGDTFIKSCGEPMDSYHYPKQMTLHGNIHHWGIRWQLSPSLGLAWSDMRRSFRQHSLLSITVSKQLFPVWNVNAINWISYVE